MLGPSRKATIKAAKKLTAIGIDPHRGGTMPEQRHQPRLVIDGCGWSREQAFHADRSQPAPLGMDGQRLSSAAGPAARRR